MLDCMLKLSWTAKQLILNWLSQLAQYDIAEMSDYDTVSEYDVIPNRLICVGNINNIILVGAFVEAVS